MPLSPSAIDRAAQILNEARRTRALLQGLPDDVRPATLSEGYAIQDRVRATWGDSIAGWKTGATAAAVQARFGTDQPFSGPFYTKTVHASPASIPADAQHHRAIESEFAFRFGETLDARASGYSREDVVEALDALVPAIEIVGPRFTDLLFGRVPTAIADNGLNAAFVFGAPINDWRRYDLPAHAVTLRVNDAAVAEGTGANVLGDPIEALLWTVNHLSSRGITVEAGQIFSTGTATGIVFLQPGDTATADFGPLGQVSLTFSA